jgi:hypothetical protein
VEALAEAQAGSLPGTISAASSSLASRNSCTGSGESAFDVNGPMRLSSGMPLTGTSTRLKAALMVAWYSARVRRV